MTLHTPSLIEQRHLALGRLYREFLSEGIFDVASDLFQPELKIDNFLPFDGDGIDAAIALAKSWRDGFPDMRDTVEAIVIEGDRAISQFLFIGTHSGTFCGYAPTGRNVRMRGSDLFEFVGTKISKWIYIEDRLSLAAGLNVVTQHLGNPQWPFTAWQGNH